MADKSVLVWFRRDLRLDDNPALQAAVASGVPVIPIFIWAPHEEENWQPGAASRWWLHQSLKKLHGLLRELGSRLILRQGDSQSVLHSLVQQTGATRVYWNRLYESNIINRDSSIKKQLKADGISVESFKAHLLYEPWEVSTQQDAPYKLFTPFWKACLASDDPQPPALSPKKISAPAKWPKSDDLDSLQLEPKIDWAQGIGEAWQPGTEGAMAELGRFLDQGLFQYADERDRPDRTGTSRLSPHLHFGEISPRQVWHAVTEAAKKAEIGQQKRSVDTFLREIGWREFGHHRLYHFPHTTDEPLREQFTKFPWKKNARALRAWQKGQTGYPIVDTGMRKLWTTGWMHNRVRMIVASFLVKHLLLPWQEGAKWFWDTLVDADLANNTLGWQWSAGCGADAAPYFRIFNPIKQGQRYDPDGEYVK